MKYEAVFGDQSLFDDAPEDAEMAASVCQMPRWYAMFNGKVLFCDSKKESWQSADFDHPGSPLLAMRRIIAEPKCWTVEDKKAGRLPEVGCECWHCKSKSVKSVIAVTATHIVINANNSVGVAPRFLLHDEFMQYYMPIETPDEKAARLREEWCIKALSSCSILSGMKEYELKRLGGYVGNIYDALLSGELSMPSKGGE